MNIKWHRSFLHFFGVPRGFLGILLAILFYHFPLVLFRMFLQKNRLDILSELMIRVLRYALADCKLDKIAYLLGLMDIFHHQVVYWKGYTIKRVKESVDIVDTEQQVNTINCGAQKTKVSGLWLADRKQTIPPPHSNDWQHTTVVFWIHGGGFCSGSSSTFIVAHSKVLREFNDLAIKKKSNQKLVYFCMDYTLSPQETLDQIRRTCIDTYGWIVDTIGVRNVIVGGDSAGGNLALYLLSSLTPKPHVELKACFIVSPWLDLSINFPNPMVVRELAKNVDFLGPEILNAWANATLSGLLAQTCSTMKDSKTLESLKTNPEYSLLYSTPTVLPRPMVIYSNQEVFGPSIQEWLTKQQALQHVKIVQETGMPHDYVLLGSLIPLGIMGRKSTAGLQEISLHLFNACHE